MIGDTTTTLGEYLTPALQTATVDYRALKELLTACAGPERYIRELQATRIGDWAHLNPINILMTQIMDQEAAHRELHRS